MIVAGLLVALGSGLPASSAPPPPDAPAAPSGAAVFRARCQVCHRPGTPTGAPDRDTLRQLSARAILQALTDGAMRYQGYALSGAERRAVAEYVAGHPLEGQPFDAAGGRCAADQPFAGPAGQPAWNGWSPTPANRRFQTASGAGLTAAQVPGLRLKWAFGFPDSTSAWAQPTVVGGRLFVGSQSGLVFALDAASGCVHWTFTADAGVRGAVSVGARRRPRGTLAAYFSDMRGTVYAVDAASGRLLWKRTVEHHSLARLTGSPTLFEHRLYVPVSSYEESQAVGPTSHYPCCTFRGSLVALDADTGAVVWKAYTIKEPPRPIGTSPDGVRLWGPSGGAIWSAPTIDPKRRAVYVGVGNSYSGPWQPTTDAIVALDLGTGRMRWARQLTPDDLYGCKPGTANCGEQPGRDFDFGSSPMLVALGGDRELIVAGQKSGMAYALDPDHDGKVVWTYRAGAGGGLGGIQWGAAADGERAYFPVSDFDSPAPGGLHAVRLADGKAVWTHKPPLASCGATPHGCAQLAAATVIPGIVFSGSLSGVLRAFSTADGHVVWQVDTHRPFPTVNGVKANGGSLNGPGPTVAGGMVYVSSGYGAYGGWYGNVLLAFGTARPTS